MWATAWMHDANEVIAPLLGLPQLPVADLPEAPGEDQPDVLHWKTRALVEAAAGRPFAWVDDEITDLDRVWVSAHHRGRALLHRVDSLIGLTGADFAALEDWLRNPAANSPALSGRGDVERHGRLPGSARTAVRHLYQKPPTGFLTARRVVPTILKRRRDA